MRKITPKTHKGMMDSPVKTEDKPVYPSFRIELVYLPEAKKWEIDKFYKIKLGLKMTGISISRYQNDAEFEIHEIGIGGGKENKEEKEYEEEDKK